MITVPPWATAAAAALALAGIVAVCKWLGDNMKEGHK